MTKLEELKAALEAASKGEWRAKPELTGYTGIRSGKEYIAQLFVGVTDEKADFARLNADATFIALSHNLMPALLESVDLLRLAAATIENEYPESDDRYEIAVRANELLEKLK